MKVREAFGVTSLLSVSGAMLEITRYTLGWPKSCLKVNYAFKEPSFQAVTCTSAPRAEYLCSFPGNL